MDGLQSIREHIMTCPSIDNHAHNLFRPEGLNKHNLLTLTSEGADEALEDALTTVSHIRATNQLRKFYDLADNASLGQVQQAREKFLHAKSIPSFQRYFENVETILVDDGYEDPEDVEPYGWHSQFTVSPCKRILRIDTVADDICEELGAQGKLSTDAGGLGPDSQPWSLFVKAFDKAITDAIADPEVVGFKSIICFISGLDVKLKHDSDATSDQEIDECGQQSFAQCVLPDGTISEDDDVLKEKGFRDYLVWRTCKLLAENHDKTNLSKPFQFHTGLGDDSMSHLKANPQYLQELIDEFPSVPIVLLHAAYPYTTQAGWLASVYKNCFLDLGLVWPKVSRHGQERLVHQALELAPWRKLLFSTDAYHHPESYYLANLQGRQAIAAVLCEYVEKGDLTLEQAKRAADCILFDNANELYSLGLTRS